MVKPAVPARLFILTLVLAMITACNPLEVRRNSHLEDSLLYYKIQMDRSNFTDAARFRNPESKWDVSGLDRFQITFYEVRASHSSDNGNKIERQVFLRYLDRNTMRERSTRYTEIWVYNSDSGQWLLEGEPPVFR
jgi:hypothetical protein